MSDPRTTPAEPTPPLGSGSVGRPGTGAGSATPATPATTPGKTSGKTSGKPTKKGKGANPNDPLRRSRTSGLWIATIAAGLLLILLIIFIVQNTQAVRVDFLGWTGTPPLSVALLVATAAGILVTGLVGSLRIFQLRRRVKRAEK